MAYGRNGVEEGGARGARAGWGLPAGLLVLALVWLLVEVRYAAPRPAPADAPAAEFSAGRAGRVLRDLVGGGSPHPVGSPENFRVRDRILAELRRLGYRPRVERGFACHPYFGCAAVENVIARLDPAAGPGSRSARRAVLLAAHYDSVPAGPGAADNLTGVAAMLEAARAMKAGPPPKNPVLFLAEDGEELGLLGARVFVDSPSAREVAAAVNLDARGSSGPSLMFETNRDNGWLIPLFAGAVSRPIASSVFQTIYERMPNDTDFSVFKHAGIEGLNFALIGDPLDYHSALDTLANASPASLQHHGENALGSVRALAGADLARPARGAAVFFDVLGFGLVHWPEPWTLPLAVVALALVAAAAVLLLRRRAAGPGGIALGLVAWLAAIVASAVAAAALASLLGAAGGLRAPWVASPAPLLAAFWLLPLAVGGAVLAAFGRRAAGAGLWSGVWIGWALAGVATAVALPGTSFLFLVPALVAGAAAVAFLAARPGAGGLPVAAVLLPAAAAAVLWFSLAGFLYDGLGSGGLAAISVLVGAVLTTLAPLFSGGRGRRAVPLAAAALVLVATVAAFLPAFSAAGPRRLTVTYHFDADAGSSRWVVSGDLPVPPSMARVAAFSPQPAYPWSPPQARYAVAAAPGLGLAPPGLTVLEDRAEGGRRHLRLRLASPRGAHSVALMLPISAVESAKVGGTEVSQPQGDRFRPRGEWLSLSAQPVPAEGIEVELDLRGGGPVSGFVVDRSPGLPPAGQALAAARPRDAVSNGDAIVVSRKVQV